MCVVDKRLEYGNTPPADSTAAPSSDRESDKHKIQIQIEDSKAPLGNKNRIYVVVRSPGSEALVNVMFQHIWGARPVRNWYSQIKAALLRLVTSKKGLCA